MASAKKSFKGSGILRVKGAYSSLKTADKRLADFILQNTKKVIELTIDELAENSKSSYATISRFCKKMGFSGFKEFKTSLANDIATPDDIDGIFDAFSINTDISVERICEKVYEMSLKILQESISMIDYQSIELAAEKLIAAENICFIGTGTSGISARYAYSKFFRIGMPSFYEADSTLYKMRASILTPRDVLFAISSSGRTAEIVGCAQTASKNKVHVISLSDFAISPLTKVSDTLLYTTPRNASLFLDIDIPLITGQIALIDILYSCCCIRMSNKASGIYNKTKASADSEKLKS